MRRRNSRQRDVGPLDRALDALADSSRRRLLLALLQQDRQGVGDAEISLHVAIRDDDVAAQQRRMVHAHLPKLEDVGFVEWDREANLVRPGPRFDDVRPLLRVLRDHDDLSDHTS